MKFQPFSDKQMEIVNHAESDYTTCLAQGAVRSGKTIAADLSFGLWSVTRGKDHNHGICGLSLETIMRNVGYDLIDIYGMLGYKARLDRSIGARIVVELKHRVMSIWLVSSGDERSQKRIQGATLMGLLIDEVVNVPRSLFFMAWSRLSVEGAKLWATFNPDTPNHWFKKEVVDRIQDFDGYLVKFLLTDNPTLSEAVRQRYEKSFTGHWYQRYIKGEWAGASGLIFPKWYEAEESDWTKVQKGQWALSMDWASSSVFCALAFRYRGKSAVCKYEMYYDAREAVTRTEQEQLEALMAWCDANELGRPVIYLDPHTPDSFKRLLRENKFKVRNADNNVLPGLVTTSQRLANRQITIDTENCPQLEAELYGYLWDLKKAELGEDKPIKENDHACDSLRYYARSTGKTLNAKPVSVERIGLGIAV